MAPMKARYGHTNLVARDWRQLAGFYIDLFGCVPVPPERDYSGPLAESGSGVPGSGWRGVHLRLPGHGDKGPTLVLLGGEVVVDYALRLKKELGGSAVVWPISSWPFSFFRLNGTGQAAGRAGRDSHTGTTAATGRRSAAAAVSIACSSSVRPSTTASCFGLP